MKHSNQGWVTLADSKKVKLKTQQITNFNSGEFSPQLAGRVDLEAFAGSARKISNLLPEVTGGLKKFYGTKHVTEIDSEPVVMVPFINRHEPMALIIRENNIGLVYSDNYEELSIRIPNGLDISKLRWKQINDRILFAHPDVQPFSIDFNGISDSGEYQFLIETLEFDEVPYFPIGWKGDYNGELLLEPVDDTVNSYTATIPSGGITVEFPYPGELVDRLYDSVSSGEIGLYGEYVLEAPIISLIKVSDGQEEVLFSGVAGETEVKTWYRIIGTTPRPSSRSLIATATRETILKTLQSYIPGTQNVNGNIVINDPTSSKIQNGDSIYLKLTFKPIFYAGELKVEGQDFVTETKECSGVVFENVVLTGRKIKIYANENSSIMPWYAEESVAAGDIRYSNGNFYKADSAGACGKTQPSHNKGTRSDGKISWTYLHSGFATGTIISVNSPNQLLIKLSKNQSLPVVSKDETLLFNTFAWSIWGTDNIHPSHIYMVQNRLGFVCNTKNFGAWNAMSISDNYFDFSTEEYGQQLDTSAIVHLILNNPDNKINWVLSYNSLYMGSDTNEFSIKGNNKILTPTTLVCDPVSSLGGAAVVPLKYKELNLFVGSKKDELYTIGYDYTIEDYVPKSIGYITNHLLEQGISRLESVHNKDQCVYILHDTGTLSVLNYVGDQAMLAYCNIDAGARVVDFCSTSSGSNRLSYMAVERNTGKISIEYVADEEPTYMWNTFEYSGEEVSEFTIPELANKNVFVVVDGQFIETTLDENGYYKFNEPTTEYAVGVKLVAEVHTQPAFGRKAEGVVQQSVKVSMRLLESGAFEYGDSTDFSKYIKFENWGTDQDYEEPHKLYTGDALLDLATGYMTMANEGKGPYPNDTGVGVNVRASTPEPFNLLSVTEIYV